MKTKLVLWGENAQDERVLIALELLAEENKVKIFTFPETVATEEFNQKLMQEWRVNKPLDFPEGHTEIVRELSATESLLPDDLKAERTDLITRAQTEWHFVVLSSKLHQAYSSELNELKEKVDALEGYDSDIWNNLKSFWNKVQSQVREKNLFRDHANTLRDQTNELFTKMKGLRSKMDEEFERVSQENRDNFMSLLDDVENRIREGLRLQKIFEELKDLQRKFRDTKLSRVDRGKVWERLDSAFKTVKEKRFGSRDEGSSPLDRLKRRYDGLLSAIEKMERSIKRDNDDLSFQNRKIERTDGQLEAQIRKAKIKMIEERVRSKEEKLSEMMKTKKELEDRLEKTKAKEEKQKEREAQEKAKREAQEKAKAEIEAKVTKLDDAGDEKLQKAAEAINESKLGSSPKEEKPETKKEESLLQAVGTTMGESLEDVVDTVRAVAEVVGDKIEDAMDDLKDRVMGDDDKKDGDKTVVEQVKAKVEAVADQLEDAAEELKDKLLGDDDKEKGEEGIIDKVKDKVEAVADQLEDAAENLKDKILGDDDDQEGEGEKSMVDKIKDQAKKVADKIEDAVDKLEDKIEGEDEDDDEDKDKKEE
jgi:gas vesicle protein